ncbi:MAG: hypothetical protein A2328_10135 [Bdellovibrionales bacterium RIFOXYB2_FULL_36_6]|nr:MAG: hypothetical protein A2328_10135 [Bdellovibrionales bacterium RIFOXYB2_FULL_36_6]
MYEKPTYEELEKRVQELEKADSERKLAEDRLKTIFNNAQDAIFIHDLEGKILDVNDKMCRMYGLTKEEALEVSIEDVSSSRMSMEAVLERWQKVLNGEKFLFEWEARRPKDESIFNVEVSLQKISFYEKDIVLANVRDITERKQIEDELKRERETLSMILERTPHGISLVDNDGNYLFVNPYFTKITGYALEDIPSKEEWFKKAYLDENYRKEVTDAWNKDILHEGMGKIREFKIKCKNGDTKHIEFRSAFLKNEKISVLTDVTARKESEEIIREKDRLQGALELSKAVCHEMTQPLMSVLGYFDLILLDMHADDPNYSRICKIQKQLERMSDITKKLMKISRYQTKDYLNEKILDLYETSKDEKSD